MTVASGSAEGEKKMTNGYDDIINMRLLNHGLTHKEDRIELSQLLGIQAQFFSYANYSAKIRQISLDKGDVFKAWTLRGTMHVHDMKDYSVFIHNDLMSKYMKDFWEDETVVTKKRKEFFCDEVIESISDGIVEKNDIISRCYAMGMTDTEKEVLFNSWGGIPRFLVETGEIVLQGTRETKYKIAPHAIKIGGVQAEIEQLRRYINTYGPVTIYDIMYFFKWNKSKCLKYICEIEYSKLNMQGEEFYYIDKCYGELDREGNPIIFSGFDPFIIGYEKKNSIIIKSQNIRDIYLLQGVIRPTLFWNNHVVGVWWKAKNVVNIKFFEKLSGEVKARFYELLTNLLNDELLQYKVVEE